MPKRRDRLIIDTNHWISFLINKDFSSLDSLIETGKIILIFSQESIDEFLHISQRPKFRKYFASSDVEALLHRKRERSELIRVQSTVRICRDPKDDFLLSLAIDGNATHLLTGDRDLLVLQRVEGTRILTITEYLSQGRL